MKHKFIFKHLSILLVIGVSLVLFSCKNNEPEESIFQPTGSEYNVDESMLGKKMLLSEAVDFSMIEQSDRSWKRTQENASDNMKTVVLNNEETVEIIDTLKTTLAEPKLKANQNLWEESEYIITYTFMKEKESLGAISVFFIDDQTVLVFEMNMVSEKLRHPSLVFISENGILSE